MTKRLPRLTAFLFLALFVHAQDTVHIKINAAKRGGAKIPATIFGSFLEPIGNSTYGGLWAEILQNPSFESGLWDEANLERMVTENPALRRASQLALPPPWEPLNDSQANRYEPRRGAAANSWESLAIFGVPGQETGVKQRVYLPVYRQLRYRGSLYVKHLSGARGLEISLRKRGDGAQKMAVSEVADNGGGEWTKVRFDLDLPAGRVAALEPVDFVIQVNGDGRVEIDEASLMPADAVDGMDPDMIDLARAMRTPLVRFGGNFTSAYHWQDGVGPQDKRVSVRNISWGIPEYNQFGTDEFLRFCHLINAQPQVALNLGSGSAEEAAGWVRYVNEHWPQHSGLLWELGNELWGKWNLGYPTLDELAPRTLAFSKAIRAVDPSARLIATGQDPDVYREWNARQLGNPAGTFDYISTHFVVTTNHMKKTEATPDEVLAATSALPVQLERQLREMQQQINASEHKRARTAFTEWLFYCCGDDVVTAPRWDNMAGAVAAAGFFNVLLRSADIVPISDMTGIIEFAGIWKKRGKVYATPSYYTFRMFSTAEPDVALDIQTDSPTYDVHEGVTRLPEIAKVPFIDAVAVLNKAGDRLSLFCINRNLDKDVPVDIALDGWSSSSKVSAQELYASSAYTGNDEAHPDLVKPRESTADGKRFTLRRESVTRIDFAK